VGFSSHFSAPKDKHPENSTEKKFATTVVEQLCENANKRG
jgi:hypothetical protein